MLCSRRRMLCNRTALYGTKKERFFFTEGVFFAFAPGPHSSGLRFVVRANSGLRLVVREKNKICQKRLLPSWGHYTISLG